MKEMTDPQIVVLAIRGQIPVASLVLANKDNELILSAFTFTDETVKTAMDKTMALLGVEPGQHVSVTSVVWTIPEGVLDAHVISRFAAAVQAKDVAYFYSLTNSKGGQA